MVEIAIKSFVTECRRCGDTQPCAVIELMSGWKVYECLDVQSCTQRKYFGGEKESRRGVAGECGATIPPAFADDRPQPIVNECEHCGSLQPCYVFGVNSRCVDWQACRERVKENKNPAVKLTDSDVAMLLERMETQQADMERLKRIEAAAISYVQASESLMAIRGHSPMLQAHTDLMAAERNLIDVVKGGKK